MTQLSQLPATLRPDPELAGRKVLLVDDDPGTLFTVRALLTRRGLEVVTAASGSQAIGALAAAGRVDLVLLDLFMPVMDGYETLQALRAIPLLQSAPVIAFTADAVRGTREACIEAGFDDYLAKPVQAEDLLERLRCWIGTRATTRPAV